MTIDNGQWTIISKSEAETQNIAGEFAGTLTSGDVVALFGDLGAGKTAFTRGVAIALGVDETQISSPTFTLVNEYDGALKLYHFDVYRLENAKFDELDWIDEYLFGDGVCLIEWAEYILPILPKNYVKVELERLSESERKITITRQAMPALSRIDNDCKQHSAKSEGG